MTIIRKLALALCLVLLCSSYSNSQTVDQTTGNIVYTTANPPPNGSSYASQGASWSGGFINTTSNGGGYSGGNVPAWNSSTGTFMFGYNQGTVAYTTAVNAALAAAGSGVQVNGLNYSWKYINQDYTKGTLSANINLTSSAGTVLNNYNYSMPHTTAGWTTFSGAETFTTPYLASTLGNLHVSFTGKDDRWWAGYYGPQVKDINVGLRYGVDPCATNPAYSTNCAGFSSVVTSGNLAPNPGGYAVYGGFLNESFAINTALSYAGSGASIHGFKWGYTANANGPYCAFWLFACLDERNPSVTTNMSITDSAGATLYSVSRYYENSYNTTNYSYLFPTSKTMNTLGNFNFTAYANDQAYIGGVWTKAIYTVDPCVGNPLYSPTCPGYGVALAKNSLLGSTVASASGPIVTSTQSQTQSQQSNPVPDPNNTTTVSSATGQPAPQQPPPPPQSSGPAADPNQNPSVAQMDPAQPSPQQPGPAPTTPQPAGGPPPQVAQQSAPPQSSGPAPAGGGPAKNNDGPKMTTTQALSIIKSVQEKDKATQQLAVQNAAKVVENSTQQSQATVTSTIASLNEMSSTSAAAAAQFSSQTTQSSLAVAAQVNQTQQSSGQNAQQTGSQSKQNLQVGSTSIASTQSYSGTGLTFGMSSYGFNSNSINLSVNNNQQTQMVSTYQPRVSFRQTEVEVPTQVASFNGISRAGNPLSEMMMQQRFELLQSNIEQRGSSVNKNVQPNELAGGVDVASMAVQPRGFELYSFVIKDSTFYPPKEVYRNQKVIDNVMVLRQMSSDRLHQEMIEQQYKEIK